MVPFCQVLPFFKNDTKNDTNPNDERRRFVVTLQPTAADSSDYFAPLRGFLMMANMEGDWQGTPVGEWDVHDKSTNADKLAQVET